MNKDPKNGMTCSEFEALLAEALDGSLAERTRHDFDEHGQSCETCGPLYAETWEGMLLMEQLAEIEPPKNLVHNILAATSRKDLPAEASAAAQPGWLDRLGRGLRPRMAGVMHSRFAASFAMAFFSLSITLTLAGVKISDIKNVDFHPTALRKSAVLGFTQVEAKVTSYYENLRLVYQVQAKVRELKKNTEPAPGSNNENRQQNRKSAPDGGRPKQYENYSQERDGSLIAESNTWHEGAQI
jgi:hypothetical protein